MVKLSPGRPLQPEAAPARTLTPGPGAPLGVATGDPGEAHPPAAGSPTIGTAPEAGHAPSERVRELVRFNPEAAAGVLQRWIGQGGHVR